MNHDGINDEAILQAAAIDEQCRQPQLDEADQMARLFRLRKPR